MSSMVLQLAREEPEAGPWRAEPLQVTVRLWARPMRGLSSCRARRSARTEATPLPVNSEKRELEKVICGVPKFVVYRHVGSRAFRPRLALYCRIDSNQGQGGAARGA